MSEIEVRNVNNRNLTFLIVLFNIPNRQRKVTLPLAGVKSGPGVANFTKTTLEQLDETQAINLEIFIKDVSSSASKMQILQTADPLLVGNALDQADAAHNLI